MFTKKGFTLIELLVVVLIIGILAAIAVPYYQESVEKSIMQEAIINLKSIAQANDVFFLQNGRYAYPSEMSKLDIIITGAVSGTENRIDTKYFRYSPDAWGSTTTYGYKAFAIRLPNSPLYLHIDKNNQLKCTSFPERNSAQKKLCDQINRDGHL